MKRRVYDSINVLYASDIVDRRKEVINLKKEYFFKPKGPIGSDFAQLSDPDTIKKRETIKFQIAQRLKNLDVAHRRYSFLSIRHAVLERLIARNRSSSVMQVTTIDLSKPISLKMNHLQSSLDRLSRGTSRSSRGDEKSASHSVPMFIGAKGIGKSITYSPSSGDQGRIKVPCYFIPITGRNVKIDKETQDLRTTRHIIQSTSPLVCYQDFELIGTLWNWNQSNPSKKAL